MRDQNFTSFKHRLAFPRLRKC